MTVDNEPRSVPPGVPASMITPTGNMPAIGAPNTQDYARLIFSAPYFEQIPIAEIIQPSVTEAVENALPSLIPPYVDSAVLAAVQQYSVLLSGSTMTGPLFLNPLMPTQPSQAATMAYVDAMLATAGIPEVPPVPVGQVYARETGQWVPISQAEGTFLPLSGGSMQGNINMSGNTISNMAAVPAMPNGAAPAQWVLNQIASVILYQGTWNADTNVPDLTQLSTHVNAYTWIALTTSPSGVVIGPPIPGLQGMTVFNGDTIIYSTVAGAFSAIHAGGITLPEADGRYVQLAGSQMSGALLLNANATQNMQAVTFQQLEAAVANTVTPDAPADGQAYLRVGVGTNRWVPGMPLAGGIFTGAVTLAGPGAAGNNPVTVTQLNSAISAAQAGFMPITGGTFQGPVILSGNATVSLNPVPLQQLNSMLGSYLPLGGGTVTGLTTFNRTVGGPPSNPQISLNDATGTGSMLLGGAIINASPTALGISTPSGGLLSSISLSATNVICGDNLSVGGNASVSGGLTAAQMIHANGNIQLSSNAVLTASGSGWALLSTYPGASYGLGVQASIDPAFAFNHPDGAGLCYIYSTGNMAIGGTLTQGSDEANKTNINPISQGISVVRQLIPKSFQRIIPDGSPDNAQNPVQWGFIAQDVQPVIPEAVGEAAHEGQDPTLTLDTTAIIAALANAVKQLDQRCSALEADVGIDPPADAVA